MPPRERFTRDFIIDAAYKIYLEKGMTALTARSIAQAIGGSTQPIFTQFETLDELHMVVLNRAICSFLRQHSDDFTDTHALLLLSKDLIETITKAPHLLLTISLNTMLKSSKSYLDARQKLLQHLMQTHHLTEENAEMLYTVLSSEAVGILFSKNQSQLENRTTLYQYLDQVYFTLLKSMQP